MTTSPITVADMIANCDRLYPTAPSGWSLARWQLCVSTGRAHLLTLEPDSPVTAEVSLGVREAITSALRGLAAPSAP